MRRIYENRTVLLVKDLQDQPEGKYIAFVSDFLGDKAAISCDGAVQTGPDMISLLRQVPDLSADAKGMTKGVPICTFSKSIAWVMLERAQLEFLNGEQWEKAKVDDGQSREKLLKALFGEDGIAKVLQLPDGRTVALPVDEEGKARMKKEMEKLPYNDSGLYA